MDPNGPPSPWITAENPALLTDLYQLTMLQAYWHRGMMEEAVFSLFVRRLPPRRNYLIACGLDDALTYLENLHFDPEGLEYLRRRAEFRPAFIDWLAEFRFTGQVWAVAEGTPIFAREPILEVVAPLPQAQLAETFLMNQIHHQTAMASKASRVVTAATGRPVMDFGLRRMHGTDAGVKAARAFYIAGVAATSNVFAGRVYGLPVAGTMAHAYIQAHDDELEALRSFTELYPDTVLLVDTYDTLQGVRKLVRLARELGESFLIEGIRLDSGDLAELAVQSRRILDEAGLGQVKIFASGNLDEDEIRRLLEKGAPVDGFGVGTRMGVSRDAPALDTVYKLTAYAGQGRVKTAAAKPVLPGRKQVFRCEQQGRATRDLLARHDESLPGRPLLHQVMAQGHRLDAGRSDLGQARACAQDQLARLPASVQALEPAVPPYPVEVSQTLRQDHERALGRLR